MAQQPELLLFGKAPPPRAAPLFPPEALDSGARAAESGIPGPVRATPGGGESLFIFNHKLFAGATEQTT